MTASSDLVARLQYWAGDGHPHGVLHGEAAAAILTLEVRNAALMEALRLFPTACDVLTRQEMRDAKGNFRSLIDQQTAALKAMAANNQPPEE